MPIDPMNHRAGSLGLSVAIATDSGPETPVRVAAARAERSRTSRARIGTLTSDMNRYIVIYRDTSTPTMDGVGTQPPAAAAPRRSQRPRRGGPEPGRHRQSTAVPAPRRGGLGARGPVGGGPSAGGSASAAAVAAAAGRVRAGLLLLLAEEPRNGYQLMQAIEERSGGRWRPSPGSVYPTLAQLEDEGLIRATERDAAKLFELTDAGRDHLAEHARRTRRRGRPPDEPATTPTRSSAR